MFYIIYNLLCWLVTLLSAPFVFLYCLFTSKYFASIKQRFGFFDFTGPREAKIIRLWFHAASVGEVQVAKAIITETKKLLPDAFIIVSTVTEQGYKAAKLQLEKEAFCVYAPIDLPWVVKRFIRNLRPTCYICLETELWPNMIFTAARSGIKLILLNGRISQNSFKNYFKIKHFIKDILAEFSSISTIMDHDQERFVALGASADKVSVNGNAKYDNDLPPLPHYTEERQKVGIDEQDKYSTITTRKKLFIDHYRLKLNLNAKQTVFIAGSTHGDEEKILLDTYNKLTKIIPDLIFILAPRHIARTDKVEAILKGNNIKYHLYSQMSGSTRKENVVLLDTMGELASLYSIADYVFCGGSFVPKGGHNIMEAAKWGKPPFYGPHMADFSDAKQMLEEQKAGFTVKDQSHLFEKIVHFHKNPAEYKNISTRAKDIAAAQTGSAKRQASIIRQTLFN